MDTIQQDEISEQITEQQVSELLSEVRHQTILHWNYRRLKVLPEQVLEECGHIHLLHLKRNLLTHLPDAIRCLSQLRYCYIHGNHLQELPDAIGELSSLQVLDIGNNKIKHLPASLGKIPSLRSLVAVYNKISSFPRELCNMKTLTVLMLSGNNLHYLPEAIGGLTGLQGLYVDHNHLKDLPRSATSLPLLTRISCCCNALTHLPAHEFKSKPALFMDDNPQLNYLPFSLIQQLRYGESWDPVILQTCGCFQDNVINENSVIINVTRHSQNDCATSLNLPPQINKIITSNGEVKFPSLFELCVRYFWNENNKIVKDVNLKLSNLSLRLVPSNIHSLLQGGPVTYCNYSKCNGPIFTSCSLIAIKLIISPRAGVQGKTVPSILYFCDNICSFSFVNYIKSLNDEHSLWLLRQLEDACHIKLQ